MSTKKTKKAFGRRFFLGGTGSVLLGLPFLESLMPHKASADVDDGRFAIFIRHGNGVAQADGGRAGAGEPERFWPHSRGALTDESMRGRVVEVLGGHRERLLMVSGLKFGFPGNGCGHSGGGNQCLTAARVSDTPSGNESLAMGESIDNRIARELNPGGAEPLTLFTGRKGSYLPEVMSYRGPRDLRAAENNPQRAYERLVGMTGLAEEQLNQIRARRLSVNDLVREQMQSLLRRDLSISDRRRLDLHFGAIRDMELAMSCRLPEMREMEMAGIDPLSAGNYQELTRMHMDIMAFAVACGLTRTATLQMGNGNDGTEHEIAEYRGGARLPRFHQISHRIYSDGSDGAPIEGAQEMHAEIDKMHGRLFSYLLDRLSSYDTPEGNLLDCGTACWTNDLGAGVSHTYNNIPFIFGGSLGGNLVQGQYVDAKRDGQFTTHNKLFNVILSAVGVRKSGGGLVDNFGDSSLETGMVPEMIAGDAPDF